MSEREPINPRTCHCGSEGHGTVAHEPRVFLRRIAATPGHRRAWPLRLRLLGDQPQRGPRRTAANPLAARPGHFPAKAKSVIFLFMAGGPSQLELFDPKPKLKRLDGQVVPESFTRGRRFAFIRPDAKLLGTQAAVRACGPSRRRCQRAAAASSRRSSTTSACSRG